MSRDEFAEASESIVVLFEGGELARRLGRRPCVISHCRLLLRSLGHAMTCDEAMMEFQRILERRDETFAKYEWANGRRVGLLLEFDIYWYDEWFFQQRRDAYRVGPHPFALRRFGATPDDLELVHDIVDGAARG